MKKVGIFFGPAGGSTEKIAKLIQREFGSENADLNLIKDAKAADLNKYDNIIFGCSTIGGETWDSDKSQSDWDLFRPELDKISYKGRVFAIFGLGNHVSYARHFVNAMGSIAKNILSKNAIIVGQCSTDGYDFIESEAVIDGKFIGLPIDEEFEPEKSLERIQKWVSTIKKEFL